MHNKLIVYVLSFVIAALGSLKTSFAIESPVQLIALAAPLSEPDAEISGLTWCADNLILMPQYPNRISTDNHSYFYMLNRKEIIDYLSGNNTKPLVARPIIVNDNSVLTKIPNSDTYEGFEAIVCEQNKLWLTVEVINSVNGYQSYLIPATLNMNNAQPSINFGSSKLITLASQSNMINMGEESLIIHKQDVISIHEVNDSRSVANAKAHRFNSANNSLDQLDFPHLPFRITDATALDTNNRFWAINYKFSGDTFSHNSVDFISTKYQQGKSHRQFYNVERLLELQLHEDRIDLIDQPPIQLSLNDMKGRNWEGIARLDDIGLLIITDKHPTTLFGFVAFSNNSKSPKH